jgi:hypothetical protein
MNHLDIFPYTVTVRQRQKNVQFLYRCWESFNFQDYTPLNKAIQSTFLERSKVKVAVREQEIGEYGFENRSCLKLWYSGLLRAPFQVSPILGFLRRQPCSG